MSGVLSGGWEFVAAAYGITALALILYSASVVSRLRAERERRRRDTARSSEVSA